MRSSHVSPPLALGSSAGRYRLPPAWLSAPPPALSPAPRAPDAAPSLYGIAEEADAALKMRRLEAVLMLAREPLHSRKLAQFAGLDDGTEARTFVRRLNKWYDEVGRSFRVEQVAGGYQMLTRAKYADWIRRQNHVPPEVRLSAPALETLAVVAYRQPVARAEVDAVRGVNCGEILRLLMERDLVRITGRSEELGRPFLYGTTRRFLEVCGLMSLEDLPRASVLRSRPGEPTAANPPLPKLSASGYTTDTESAGDQSKENDVSVLTMAELQSDEATKKRKLWGAALPQPRMDDEDDDAFDDDDDDLDDDEDDELDDEEDDLDDDEEDDEEDDDVDEDFDDEWEEVDDEDGDDDEEDEDDDEDDEDDDWDDDEDEDEEEDDDL